MCVFVRTCYHSRIDLEGVVMTRRLLALIILVFVSCVIVPSSAYAKAGDALVEIEIGSTSRPTAEAGPGWKYDPDEGDWGTVYLEEGYAFSFSSGVFYLGDIKNNGGTILEGVFGGTVTNTGGIVKGGGFSTGSIVLNDGSIEGGSFQSEVYNGTQGVIFGGVFKGGLNNEGVVRDGSFEGWVENEGTIHGGEFHSDGYDGEVARVVNRGTFAGGAVYAYLLNESGGLVEGGSFLCLVANHGTINNGLFEYGLTNEGKGAVVNDGTFKGKISNYSGSVINGGVFASDVYNYGLSPDLPDGTILNGTFKQTVYNIGGGSIEGGIFENLVHNDQDSSVKGGRFFRAIRNKGGDVSACEYLVTLKLANMLHTLEETADGRHYVKYAPSGENGIEFSLQANKGYVLPSSISVSCEVPGGEIAPVEDFMYNAKTGKVRIGKNSVSGPLTITAEADKSIDIADASVDPIEDQTFTGGPLMPKPTVIYDNDLLKEGVDYTLAFEANVNIGEASIVIVGKGDYGGTKIVAFKIVGALPPGLSRLEGTIALDTMTAIVQRGFENESCSRVVVATMGGYWDALTAASLAGLESCPILLTDKDELSSQTLSEIKRLGASKVYIVGGEAAVSDDVEKSILSIHNVKTVRRLAGDVAVDTALEIYKEGNGSWGKTAVVATSETFQDALSISPYAYAKKAPIFLANASTHALDSHVLTTIQQGGFSRVIIVGGTAALSPEIEKQLKGIACKRLAGATAYETSGAIASWCLTQGMTASSVGIATGESYYDALAGASLCGRNNAALVLISDSYRSSLNSFVKPNRGLINEVYVFGGPAAVSESTFDAIALSLR